MTDFGTQCGATLVRSAAEYETTPFLDGAPRCLLDPGSRKPPAKLVRAYMEEWCDTPPQESVLWKTQDFFQ